MSYQYRRIYQAVIFLMAFLPLPPAFACGINSDNGPYSYHRIRAADYVTNEKRAPLEEERFKKYLDSKYGAGLWRSGENQIRVDHYYPDDKEAPESAVIVSLKAKTEAGRNRVILLREVSMGNTQKKPEQITELAEIITAVPSARVLDFTLRMEVQKAVLIHVWAVMIGNDGTILASEPLTFLKQNCGGWGAYGFKERRAHNAKKLAPEN